MIEFYEPIIERAIECARNNGDVLSVLRELPLSVFARLLVQPAVECPALVECLPKVAPPDIQIKYNGRADLALLPSSVSFVESMCHAYTKLYGRKFPVGGKVLDYGFGWGRLIRMAYWLTNPNDVYGFDPQQASLDICKASNLRAHLMLCDEVPASLQGEEDVFDLVYSFSVFTHVSFKAANAILKTLRRHVNSDGMLTITIRPIEFWDHYRAIKKINEAEYEWLLAQHRKHGFAHIPLKGGWKAVDGEVHFGDASMSSEFIRANWPEWKIVGSNLTLEDPYQVHIFMVPA